MKHAIYVIVNGQLKLLSAYNNKEIAESLYKKYSRNGKFKVMLAMYNENIPVVTTEDLYTLGIKKIAGDLQQENKQLKQEVEELKQRCKDLQAESDSKDTAVFNANAKYNELKKKYEEKEFDYTVLKNNYEELERKCDFIDFNFSIVNSHKEELEKNNIDLTRKNEKLNRELTGIKLENYYLEEKLNKKKWWQR